MTKHISTPAPQRPSPAVVRELLRKVLDIGGNADAIVARAGLAPDANSLIDASWNGPLTRGQFTAIYHDCANILSAHANRLEKVTAMAKAETDMLCYCVITCSTLTEVIERAAAFCAMLGGRAGKLSVEVADGMATFRMRSLRKKRDVSAFVADLTGLSAYYRLFGWLIGMDIELLEVRVCYAPLLDERVAARLMPYPITYGATDNLIRFPAKYLESPVMRSYAELVRLLEHFPFDLDEAQSMLVPMSERVRVTLGTALAQRAPFPTAVQLAAQFSISVTTLKRRLAAEGTSLVQLKERCRRELAIDLLGRGTLPLGEIALRLGFSDSTTLSRAFKQWTGLSPSTFRKTPTRVAEAQYPGVIVSV